jgi:hypothetical protein
MIILKYQKLRLSARTWNEEEKCMMPNAIESITSMSTRLSMNLSVINHANKFQQ